MMDYEKRISAYNWVAMIWLRVHIDVHSGMCKSTTVCMGARGWPAAWILIRIIIVRLVRL